MKNNLVMLASFPPPICGQSLAAKILSDGLDPDEFNVYRLDFTESIQGDSTFQRIRLLSQRALQLVAICAKNKDLIVYLQLGYSRNSILRDMIFMSIAKLFRKPCVVHVHGSGFRIAFDKLPAPIKIIEQRLLRSIRYAIVLSDNLRSMFNGLIPNDKIVDIPNGITPDTAKDALQFQRSPRSMNDTFNILFLSNLLRMKGYETVLYAALQAKTRGENWHFDIVGPKLPNQGVDIERFIIDNQLESIVTWHDTLEGDAKSNIYKNAHCFVMPSFFEGQPLCILEAMHFALPVVAKPVGGIPDIFKPAPDGIAFYGNPCEMGSQPTLDEVDKLVQDDAILLDAQLSKLANDPMLCQHMGSQNQQAARLNYTPQAHVERVAQLFRNCIH